MCQGKPPPDSFELGVVGEWARTHLEVREVLGHEIVDLTDGKASGFTVLKSHEDEDAEDTESP